jgi:hypothetical protein
VLGGTIPDAKILGRQVEKAQQMSTDFHSGSSLDPCHMIGTNQSEERHMGELPQAGCSPTSPKSASITSDGVFSSVIPERKPPSCVGGAKRNGASGNIARSLWKHKSLKFREAKSICVLRKDVAMGMVSSLAKKALVGIFFYTRMNKNQLADWVLIF